MALELLEWNRNDVNTIHIGKMHYTQPNDYLWAKKGKAMKFILIMGILMMLGKVSMSHMYSLSAICLDVFVYSSFSYMKQL